MRTDLKGEEFDHERFLNFFRREGRIVSARYYAPVEDVHEEGANVERRSRQQKMFLQKFARRGYEVVMKTIKTIRDQKTGKLVRKGNQDVEIAVDATLAAVNGEVDEIVLLSTDRDYAHLVRTLVHPPILVHFTVVGSKRTSWEIKKACTRFLCLETFVREKNAVSHEDQPIPLSEPLEAGTAAQPRL